MILAYLWLDKSDLKPEENLGYNLYGKYTFNFNKDENTLYIRENENYIDDFYKINGSEKTCIDSLTCIVGENGAGKTTLLENIVNFSASKAFINHNSNYYLAVWYDKENNKWYYCNSDNNEVKIKITFGELKNNDIQLKNKDEIRNAYSDSLAVILYANVFDDTSDINNKYINWDGFYDLRTNTLINSLAFKYYENHQVSNPDKVSIYQHEEYRNKFKFFLGNSKNKYHELIKTYFKKSNQSTNFTLLRDYAVLEPFYLDYSDHKKQYVTRFSDDNSFIIKYLDNIENFYIEQINNAFRNIEKANKSEKKHRIIVYQKWLYSYIMWILITDRFSMFSEILIIEKHSLDLYFKKIKLKTINSPIKILNQYNTLIKSICKKSKIDKATISTAVFDDINKGFQEFLKLLDKSEAYNEENKARDYKQLVLSLKNDVSQQLVTDIIEQYSLSQANLSFGSYCRFGWWRPLSTGENSMLTLLARLYSTISSLKYEESNLLILLDEAEIGFHPYWLKQYIAALIEFFNLSLKLLGKEKTKIQLVITTNNPIPLSDIQPSDVIYLENHKVKEMKNKKAFGTDLLTLYSDSFFINDGLIGKFADEKIKEILNYCINNNVERNILDKYKKIAMNIGDDFVRDYVLSVIESQEDKAI